MEHLVNMRRRIKTIDIIKKITNAMRLISMSMHTRLKDRKSNLEYYKNTFYELWANLAFVLKDSKNNLNDIKLNSLTQKPNLIILTGSQKGLCGVFNSNLFKLFEEYNLTKSDKIITVSKYAHDYIKSKNYVAFEYYDYFSPNNFIHISQNITNIIIKNLDLYDKVILFGNYSKTFFTQEPRKNLIYPLEISQNNGIDFTNNTKFTNYVFEQSAEVLSNAIEQFIISINIQDLLYESLLAEQAARFLSMDSATQNAQNLLNRTKLEYNKSRQANITRELTELSVSFNQI